MIVIVLDTLRKDALPVYGGKSITPNLEKFSQDSVVFQNAIAPSSWTVPSHVSIFTGLYPRKHGVHEDFEGGPRGIFRKLHEFRGNAITKKLKDFGYNTLGLSANGQISPGTGFENFFDNLSYYSSDYSSSDYRSQMNEIFRLGRSKIQIVRNSLMKGKVKDRIRFYASRKDYLMRRKILNYPLMKGADNIVETLINSHYGTPLFLFLNFVEVHEPLCKWEIRDGSRMHRDLIGFNRISESRILQVKENYIQALSNLDKQIGRLFYDLKQRKIYDDSLIIVTSDHGQSMKENRKFPYYGHGNFVYDELTNVPLIVKLPGNKKIKQKQGYQSLTKIPKLIESVFEGNDEFDISEKAVFSESYGYSDNYYNSIKSGSLFPKGIDMNEIRSRYFYPRRAVYKDGSKLTVNQLTGEIDEFLFNGKDVSPENKKSIVEDLSNELMIFSSN